MSQEEFKAVVVKDGAVFKVVVQGNVGSDRVMKAQRARREAIKQLQITSLEGLDEKTANAAAAAINDYLTKNP